MRSTAVTPLLWNSFIIAGERDIGHRDNMFAGIKKLLPNGCRVGVIGRLNDSGYRRTPSPVVLLFFTLYPTDESSVIAFSGDDVPYPATRVFHVSMPPGDKMDMAVKNRLPCRLADINPDVESGNGSIFLPDRVLRPQEEIVASFHFRGPKVEPPGNMASGDNQGVERGHRISIPDDEGQLILRNGAIFGEIAERASFRLVFERFTHRCRSLRTGRYCNPMDLRPPPSRSRFLLPVQGGVTARKEVQWKGLSQEL